MTKRFVRDHLSYVHVVTDDGASALQVKRSFLNEFGVAAGDLRRSWAAWSG
jgi:hypothetical protein